MARTTRSKAAATAPDPVKTEAVTAEVTTTSAANVNGTEIKPEKDEPKDDSRSKGQRRRGLRRKVYKKAKRHQNVEELQKTMESAAGRPMSKKERSVLRAQAHTPHRVRAKATTRKVSELEKLVKKQQEEIRELRKLAVGSIPKLQPPASPPAAGPEDDAEPDSSPAKIRDQLFADAARSSGGGGAAQDGTTVLEVEEVVVESAGEPMEGVEETTVVTSVEQDVEYPALPSVEDIAQAAEESSGDKQEDQPEAAEEATEEAASAAAPDPAPKLAADTPIKSKEEVRDSSAEDSNAGTPRNVRRSPRKKAPKRRSFAGHSYAG